MDLDDGYFVGRGALLEIRAGGPKRKLTGVVIAGSRLETLAHPVPMSAGADVLGDLRSAAWSPRFGTNLGLALLNSGVSAGTRATVLLPTGLKDVTTVTLPFEEVDIRPLCH